MSLLAPDIPLTAEQLGEALETKPGSHQFPAKASDSFPGHTVSPTPCARSDRPSLTQHLHMGHEPPPALSLAPELSPVAAFGVFEMPGPLLS